MGWLRFSESKKKINCINRPSIVRLDDTNFDLVSDFLFSFVYEFKVCILVLLQAHAIPVHVEDIKGIYTSYHL